MGRGNALYYVIIGGEFRLFRLKDLMPYARSHKLSGERLWSARLGTGLLGTPVCPSGNRGPKGMNEVLLAIGDAGLRALIELGCITCPACRPESATGFWSAAEEAVRRTHGIDSLEVFLDRSVLPFDARRVAWEALVPAIGQWPERLYVPRDLTESDLAELKARIETIGCGAPLVGYYDADAPGRFTAHALP